eukprot:3941830-Rhodomonas_salina.1
MIPVIRTGYVEPIPHVSTGHRAGGRRQIETCLPRYHSILCSSIAPAHGVPSTIRCVSTGHCVASA